MHKQCNIYKKKIARHKCSAGIKKEYISYLGFKKEIFFIFEKVYILFTDLSNIKHC